MEELDGLELRHLRYFLAVARTGKISAASQELDIAQPSLSQLIQRLERRLGITLFVRNARGVELTAGGKVFRDGVEQILDQLKTVLAEAGSTSRAVRVGVCAGVPASLLALMEKTLALHCSAPPGKSIGTTFSAHASTRQIELLRLGELDFGIVRLPADEPDLIVATVCDQELGVVTHIDHSLAKKESFTWNDLRGQRLLWFDARRAPGYAKRLLAEVTAYGWNPRLHTVDGDRHALFTYTLGSVHDLVALRPESTVATDPQLVWHPLAETDVPRERLGLAALRDGGHAATVREIAAAGDLLPR
ncbi:LysR family transcriptional regulator [Amycolatopsis sp. H20-H5]|uniref:LysR family transcriptional regulator n=1 Tax=Amycolatopsis sp. H20-H5 TaxID=3046309 RepID=UPI002DBEE31E|nr:LysR family transcriptional regulator [Amycolatopsis sp. H20-H5]MEC3980943.1 LysR family transcriptional regulator [Amycolatopsis sp. H20-H5]